MSLIQRLLKPGLHNKIARFSLLFIVVQVLSLAMFSIYYLQQNLEQEIGKKALAVSQAIANSEIIRLGLVINDSKMVQAHVEQIRQLVDAKFIVVGDTNGIRLSHPNIEKIGKKMIGGDNSRALIQGESYVSSAVGSLGLSLRGKSPVRSKHGDIIGLVSVGYLKEDINHSVAKFKRTFILLFSLMLIAGIGHTFYISKRYRDEIFGLEPEEIARTYSERKAVLESILDAIIVVDERGLIITLNPVAKSLLKVKSSIIGSPIIELFPEYQFLFSEHSQSSWRDIEINTENHTLLMNKTPLLINGKDKGVVLTFQLKDELIALSKKLSQVEQFSTMLRVQTHEYSNKLNTIGGLIQIGSIDEALELISNETEGYQDLIEFLLRAVPDPIIAGLILGKYNAAKEQHIDFVIEPESSLCEIPRHIPHEKLVTIIGNLIDNAFDASMQANRDSQQAKVTLAITDLGPDIIFEIEDNGSGINENRLQDIFSLGTTNKTDMGHGIGMYLVKSCLDQIGGSLSISPAKPHGTVMTVYVPKQPVRQESL